MPALGVIALQGGVAEHGAMLSPLADRVFLVRDPSGLRRLDGIILPGGESTALLFLLKRWGLFQPLKELVSEGLPVFGTCAGAVLLSRVVTERDHQIQQESLQAADVKAERNSFGRQVASFTEDLSITGLDTPFPGVFIRAPLLTPLHQDAVTLGRVREGAVLIRQKNVWLSSFHPELTRDDRIHRMFLRESGLAGA